VEGRWEKSPQNGVPITQLKNGCARTVTGARPNESPFPDHITPKSADESGYLGAVVVSTGVGMHRKATRHNFEFGHLPERKTTLFQPKRYIKFDNSALAMEMNTGSSSDTVIAWSDLEMRPTAAFMVGSRPSPIDLLGVSFRININVLVN
jgi:hypothetical protein